MDFQCRNLERQNRLFFLSKMRYFWSKCVFLAQKYDFLHGNIGFSSVFDYIYRCAHLFIDAAASINRWPHLFIDAAASIHRWPHLFIDAAASINRWPHLFIDAAASINRWPHLFIDGRIYL